VNISSVKNLQHANSTPYSFDQTVGDILTKVIQRTARNAY
jgi:hypothetical protein